MKNCFGNNCGTSIDIRDIDFANPSPNLVYMDKVFSRRKSSSCPLMTELNTGEGCSENFVVELATYGGVHTNECHCGCDSGCDSVVIGTPPVFNVEKSYVEMEYFNNYPPGHTECMHASFDGVHTCSINYTNGRYLINTANINGEIQNSKCASQGLPTKCFFLLQNAGPWQFRAKYILEGTVSANGKVCCFKAKVYSRDNTPNETLPPCLSSNFSIEDLSIPCTVDGIAPDVFFQFSACANLINPRLVLQGEGRGLALITGMAITPTLQVEVVRRTLFNVNAREGLLPCDGVSPEEDVIMCNFDKTCKPQLPCNTICPEPCSNGCRESCSNGCYETCNDSCNDSCNNGCTNNCNSGCSCNNYSNSCGSLIEPRTAFQYNGCNGCSW
ncbi:MAG: hypothetical protein RR131_05020 [Anaerovorax sp.]